MHPKSHDPGTPEVTPAARRYPKVVRPYLEHEALRYVLSAGLVLLITLLVPDLLNNMFLTFAVLLFGVAVLPALLSRRRP